jgi:hypothetical protein
MLKRCACVEKEGFGSQRLALYMWVRRNVSKETVEIAAGEHV